MTSLDLVEAVPLGYAMIARVARDSGVRALAIKGPVLEIQGLRRDHESVDIDVLVDPDGREHLERRLFELGWGVRFEPTSAQILPLHSRALSHPSWPCEIDLHDRYPGFFREPNVVFDVLWRRRTIVKIAESDVESVDVVGSAAIAALHLLRDGREQSRAFRALVSAARELHGSEQLREGLTRLAQEAGAVHTLAPLLDALGAPVATDLDGSTHADRLAWAALTAYEGGMGVPALFELSNARKRHWPKLIWRSLWLTEPEIREAQPDARAGVFGLLAARVRRLWWASKGMPGALRTLRRARTSANLRDR